MSDEKYIVFDVKERKIALLKDKPASYATESILPVNTNMTAEQLREITNETDDLLEIAMLTIARFRCKVEDLIYGAEVDVIEDCILDNEWYATKKDNVYLLKLTTQSGQTYDELRKYVLAFVVSKKSVSDCWENFAGTYDQAKAEVDFSKMLNSTGSIKLTWGILNYTSTDTDIIIESIETETEDLQSAIERGLDVNLDCIDNTVSSMQSKIKEMEAEIERLKKIKGLT